MRQRPLLRGKPRVERRYCVRLEHAGLNPRLASGFNGNSATDCTRRRLQFASHAVSVTRHSNTGNRLLKSSVRARRRRISSMSLASVAISGRPTGARLRVISSPSDLLACDLTRRFARGEPPDNRRESRPGAPKTGLSYEVVLPERENRMFRMIHADGRNHS
jgi:hypothetical protein